MTTQKYAAFTMLVNAGDSPLSTRSASASVLYEPCSTQNSSDANMVVDINIDYAQQMRN